MSKRNGKRFQTKFEENKFLSTVSVIVDVETGVNYILAYGIGGASVTPLLDSEGKVVIDKK